MRDAVQTSSPLRARLVALLCMAGLVVSWSHSLAHHHATAHSADSAGYSADSSAGHPAGHAASDPTRANPQGQESPGSDSATRSRAGDDDFRLSSDDSHHQHSSRQAIEIEACLACRSGSHDDADRAAAARLVLSIRVEGRLPTPRTESWQRVPRHAHSPRAPPAQSAPIA